MGAQKEVWPPGSTKAAGGRLALEQSIQKGDTGWENPKRIEHAVQKSPLIQFLV